MKKWGDRMIMYYLSGFVHGVLFMILVAFAILQYGCSRQRAAYLVVTDTYDKSLPPPCIAAKPPRLGVLLQCDTSGLDAGFCERINVLRKLDHYQRLVAYGDYVTATCDLWDRPHWN